MFRKLSAAILQNNPWGDPPSGGGSGGGSSGGGWGRGPRRGGGSGGGDPGMPPDLEELFRRSKQNFNRAMPPGFTGQNGWIVLAAGAFVIWCLSGIYSVSGGEQGVVLRFGKLNRTTPPGLHMHLPYPIETVLKPNVGIVNQIDIGTGGPGAGNGRDNKTISPAGQMLTQDKNILNMHFRIMWRIDDAAKYLFNLRDTEGTIRAAGESVMRQLVGQRTFDAIVRGGREELGQRAKEMLQEILNSYEAGVLIVDVLPQKIDPPAEVIDAFNDVQRAEQDAEKEINQAEAYKSDVVPRARGEAEKIKLDASAYREQARREAEGEAERFLSVYNVYRTSSDLTTKRMYIETMQEIIKNSPKIYVDGKSSNGVLPFLPLNDLMAKGNRTPANASTPTENTETPR